MSFLPRRLSQIGGNSALAEVSRTAGSLSQSKLNGRRANLRTKLSRFECRRHYAQETTNSLERLSDGSINPNLLWPTPNSANPYEIPTPYQIFRMSRDAPYSKRRFYELVKLYHPDRAQQYSPSTTSAHAQPEQLSQGARLERYRMVIAANELLSDPRRRKAYDKYGIGWDGKPEFGTGKPRWADVNNRDWSGFDDNVNNNPFKNATWEDWERWHMRAERTGGEQRPTFTSNGTFVIILVLAAGFATVGETVRMHGFNRTMIQQVEERHDVNSKELFRRRRESREFDVRDERTRRFLTIRGPMGSEVDIRPVGQEKEGSEFVPDDEVR